VLTAATWKINAKVIRTGVIFLRAVILARLLPVEVFGVYAAATAIVALTAPFAQFGMGAAFLHRCKESRDELEAASAHFTLKAIFTAFWMLVMIASASFFSTGRMLTALLLLIGATAVTGLTNTPKLILVRRVVHQRLASIEVIRSIVTTITAVALAYQGATLWALLSMDAVAAMVSVVALYLWRPVWRPVFSWNAPVLRYFLKFGSRNFLAGLLSQALRRADILWTQFYLGSTVLGFYSRSITFARYPNQIVAQPIQSIVGGAYAELKGNRKVLSQAFYRTNALLVRAGFLLGGVLILVAPEFIRIVLGVKWMPMLDTFRLMLVFILLEPIRGTVQNLFIAVGAPEKLIMARLIQFGFLICGLYVLGTQFGIVGVAVTVNATLFLGLAILFTASRRFVDCSVGRIFLTPILALVFGIAGARVAITLPGILGSDWRTGGCKIIVFVLIYGGLMLLLESREVAKLIAFVRESRSLESRRPRKGGVPDKATDT
jgi:PST family polysaccharide transporter